ncbi:AMP-binding protein [Cellulomonas marina]|uniref:Bile acid-coenzyme A ligase n=1 Tax=Cellulomonas marina TaxID=988821 RepID=A0A1I0XTT5_9CELL|nr:AMP-binding protein [Cellulomonas marina]GIG30007.1 acid--CoA ligase [Cellulomonas marina]SFB03598.1 bile acid-coenzyme A ligase [Cellulomonas marina]
MRRSISAVLSWLAETDPDRVVVVAPDGVLTAGELDRRGTRLARALLAHGVRRDDLVTVDLSNGAAHVVACAAVWRAGATPQTQPPALSEAERAELAALARPRVVLVGPAQGDAATTPPRVEVALHPLPPVPDADDQPLPDTWATCWKAPTTSGSTGRPKLVLAAAPALVDPTQPVAPFLPRGQVQLVAGPLHHSAVFTYAYRGLMTGHRLVVLPRFDARAWLGAVAEHGVTWALLVPTTIRRLLALPPDERAAADVSSLRMILHLGAPIAPADKRALLDWLGPERVLEVYAGSESNGLTLVRGDEWLHRPGTVGRPVGGTRIRVLRADGSEASPGETGTVWLHRGDAPPYRYRGGTSRRTADGWDTLGDAGYLDADGWLFLLDRADDLVVRGGVNVWPAEVERILEADPTVRSAVAFGVPDLDLGRALEAVVEVAEGAPEAVAAALASILARTAPALGPERRLRRLHAVHAPVRDDAGKVNRRALAVRVADRASCDTETFLDR